MPTEQERVVRWKALVVLGVALIGGVLVVGGFLTGAEWVQALVPSWGLFGA